MRRFLRIVPAALALTVLMLAVACGGGGDEQTSSDNASELFVSNPAAALAASADRLEKSVTTVRADFTFNIDASGFKMGATGEFAYRAPDSMHMTMKLDGGGGPLDLGNFGEFEILMLGGELYMNSSATGWVSMSLEDLGVGGSSFRDLLSSHSPLDYRAILKAAGATTENLGEEDGNQHVRMTMQLGDLMNALQSSLGGGGGDGSTGDAFGNAGISGPITLDIWVDAETLLPQRFAAEAKLGIGSQSAAFTMEVKFLEYNGASDFPEAPKDAKPFNALAAAGG